MTNVIEMKICPKGFCYRRNREFSSNTAKTWSKTVVLTAFCEYFFRLFVWLRTKKKPPEPRTRFKERARIEKKIKSRPALQPPPSRRRARYKRKVLNALKAYFVCYCASAWNSACSWIKLTVNIREVWMHLEIFWASK